MTSVKIREATPKDFEFVAELMDKALSPFYGGDHRAHARRIFSTHVAGGQDAKGHFSREQRMYIAVVNGESAGMIHIVGKKQETFKISPIIVAPELRGKLGVGSRLLSFAEQYARSQDGRQIYCTVAGQNRAALQFFLRKGYLRAGSSESHYMQGVTEFMLYKPLLHEETLAKLDEPNISVEPMRERHKSEATALMLEYLPRHFYGVDLGWVEALYAGYARRHTADINEKYKLIYVATGSDGEVLGVVGATPKKGQPIKVMPVVAAELPAVTALVTDIPHLLESYGHKLYIHIVPSVEQVMILQRAGWQLDCMMPAAYHDEHITQQWGFSYGEDFMRKMRVKGRLLRPIKQGQKTLEVRVGYDNIREIEVGERVRLMSHGDEQVVRMKDIRIYDTFAEMLDREEPSQIVPGMNRQEVGELLRRIYPPRKENLGVYVFELELEN